jgi:hypothetical protein
VYEAERDSYQLGPRSIGMRVEILHDVSVVAPLVDESELEYRRINATKWEDILVNQCLPDRCELPKDLLCFMEVLRIDAKGLEGHWLVVQSPLPNLGSSTRCHCNFPAFLEPS